VRELRYIGLALFAVVVGKVFLSDLAHLGQGWRILALLVLGCIVLLGSLVYLRNQQHFAARPGRSKEG